MKITVINKVKKLAILVLLIAPLLIVQNVVAKELKMGVVDIARVLEESPQADVARKRLQEEFSPREKDLVAEQQKIRKLEEQLVRDGAIMSESERAKLERRVISLKRDAKRSQDEFREDLNFKRTEILEALQRKLITTIQKHAKELGYDIVLAEGVIYADDSVNITKEILTKLK